MTILQKVRAKTPRKHRVKGQIATVISAVCSSVLLAGAVTNPIGIAALIAGTIIFGGKAGYHSMKVQK